MVNDFAKLSFHIHRGAYVTFTKEINILYVALKVIGEKSSSAKALE